MIFNSSRLNFDADRFNFPALVHEELNAYLATHGRSTVPSLDQIHEVSDIHARVEDYRQLLFTLFRKPDFQRIYRELGKQLIEAHFSPSAVIQKTPTARIHPVGGTSVSFHSDAWYGHGRCVYSFWLPLTSVYGSNSLQLARSVDESKAFLRYVQQSQIDLDEINRQATSICEPVKAAFGDLIVFNADVVHGTLINKTCHSRVSFDFRIAESIDEIGDKPAANFYSLAQLAELPTTECNFAELRPAYSSLMYSGTCRGITAKSQLIFLNEYARINNIKIVGSESEIVVFDYAPVLQKYIENPPSNIDSIMLFSVELLPKVPALRRKIYRDALDSGIAIIFGAEDVVLTGERDIDRVEGLLQCAGKNERQGTSQSSLMIHAG